MLFCRSHLALAPVALAILLPSCTPSSALVSAPTRAATQATAAPPPRTLVWTRTTEYGEPFTFALSERGAEVAKLPGIRIAAAGTEWTWEETAETVETAPCERDGETDKPAGEGHATRVRLVPADTAHDPLALVVPPVEDGDNEIEHSARLLASVGPYLFVEESTYEYSCGAHGESEVHFAVWNVEDGSTLDLLSEMPEKERIVAEAKNAIDDDPDGADFSSDDDPPRLTELLPRLGRHGRLEASALVSFPSCYACTEGGFSSYTNSRPVPVELPARLRELGPVPRAVQLFADAHPNLTVAGYSVDAPPARAPAGARPSPSP